MTRKKTSCRVSARASQHPMLLYLGCSLVSVPELAGMSDQGGLAELHIRVALLLEVGM